MKNDPNDVPMPDRAMLEKALSAAQFAKDNAGRLSPEELEEILEAAKWALHAIPSDLNFIDLMTRHPVNQVYFRAGLWACREYMARFVEQGGDKTTAQSIRANWWPQLGDDPGVPRLFDFTELCDELIAPDGKVSWKTKDISINVEALPRAFQFLTPYHQLKGED